MEQFNENERFVSANYLQENVWWIWTAFDFLVPFVLFVDYGFFMRNISYNARLETDARNTHD